MTRLQNYKEFEGRQWETGPVRNAMSYQGFRAPHTGQAYSEALLMGVSGGAVMGYFSFAYEGYDPMCRILTRNTFDPFDTMLSRLGIVQEVRQTTNPKKALENLEDVLDAGLPALVWADAYSLPYHSLPYDEGMWMMTPVLVFGIEKAAGRAWIADRAIVPLTVTLAELEAARGRVKKDKFKIVSLGPPNPDKLVSAVQAGIRDCIKLFTEKPPKGSANNFGLKAYDFWIEQLTRPKARLSWAKVFPPGIPMYAGLTSAYDSVNIFNGYDRAERALYADFLEEAKGILGKDGLSEAAGYFRSAADAWGALGRALLPDSVEPLGDAREALRRRQDLFVHQGRDALEEMRSINARLGAIRESMENDFPLDEDETVRFLEGVAENVAAVRDVEEKAVSALKAAME